MPSPSAPPATPGAALARSLTSASGRTGRRQGRCCRVAPSWRVIGRAARTIRWAPRAIYLGASLYRIHGSNEPDKIGQAVSSGCIRLTNQDVIDLYNRVRIGATVIVQ